MKWDPQTQEWVDQYGLPVVPPKRGNLFHAVWLVLIVIGFAAGVLAAIHVGDGGTSGESPSVRGAGAGSTPVLTAPSPATGDIPLTARGVDAAAASILHGYLNGGQDQAAFIVSDIKRVTGCAVVYGNLGLIQGLRKEFDHDTRLLEREYGDMVGSAVENHVGINVVFRCG